MIKIIGIELDPSKDIAKLPKGAIARGIVVDGGSVTALFEANDEAPLVPVEFIYPVVNGDSFALAEGSQFVGSIYIDADTAISMVYSKEM